MQSKGKGAEYEGGDGEEEGKVATQEIPSSQVEGLEPETQLFKLTLKPLAKPRSKGAGTHTNFMPSS